MNPTTKETNDVMTEYDPDIDLLSMRDAIGNVLISGATADRIIARLRTLDYDIAVIRATWGDVLPGDRLALGHDGKLCTVVRVCDQDHEYLAVTTDCGSGEHVAIVERTGAVR